MIGSLHDYRLLRRMGLQLLFGTVELGVHECIHFFFQVIFRMSDQGIHIGFYLRTIDGSGHLYIHAHCIADLHRNAFLSSLQHHVLHKAIAFLSKICSWYFQTNIVIERLVKTMYAFYVEFHILRCHRERGYRNTSIFIGEVCFYIFEWQILQAGYVERLREPAMSCRYLGSPRAAGAPHSAAP